MKRLRIPDIDDIVIGKNPSYWQSVALGLGAGLGYAPLQAIQALRAPILDLVTAVFGLLSGLGSWLFVRAMFLGCGLGGHIKLRHPALVIRPTP